MNTTAAANGKTLAIFGAGPGLGASVATRFGREGYRVALVARRAGPLEERVAELGRAGVDAAAFPGDLTDIGGIPALVRAIEEKLGAIDVALFAPVTADVHFVPAVELGARKLEALSRLLTLAPVEVAHSLLPRMLARGDGSLVFASGATAVHARPGMSGVGPAMAATRNYVFSLNGEVLSKGVYAGHITIGAMIERSTGLSLVAQSGMKVDPSWPVLDPNVIAAEVWDLVTKRDRVEAMLPAPEAT
jgi:short-subunit dehydrogenase